MVGPISRDHEYVKNQIKFLSHHAELADFRMEWEALYEESNASPYLSYNWVNTALRYFPPTGGFFLAVIRDEEGLKAIIPLEISRERFGPFDLRVLKFAFDGWSLRNGAILAPRVDGGEEIQLIAEAAEALSRDGVRWDYCRMTLLSAKAVAAVLDGVINTQGTGIAAIDCVRIGSSIVVELPVSWEAYYKKLSRHRKHEIRRRIKQLQERGVVRLVRLGLDPSVDKEELNRLIEDAYQVSLRSWQGSATEGHAISDEDIRGFFREISYKCAEKGELDLSALYLNEVPISFIWGLSKWPYTYFIKRGFDKKFSEFSPGYVHTALLVMDSISRSGREIDFGHEFPEYKRKWGTREDALYNVFIYPYGFLPATLHRLRILKRMWGKCRARLVGSRSIG